MANQQMNLTDLSFIYVFFVVNKTTPLKINMET